MTSSFIPPDFEGVDAVPQRAACPQTFVEDG